MHCHWQATPPSPGFALPTNLCSVLSFPSIMLSPSSQSLKWSILRTLPSFALSIFLAWPLSSNTVSLWAAISLQHPQPHQPPLYLVLCAKESIHLPSLNTVLPRLSHFPLQQAFHILSFLLLTSSLSDSPPCSFCSDPVYCPTWSLAFMLFSKVDNQTNQIHSMTAAQCSVLCHVAGVQMLVGRVRTLVTHDTCLFVTKPGKGLFCLYLEVENLNAEK